VAGIPVAGSIISWLSLIPVGNGMGFCLAGIVEKCSSEKIIIGGGCNLILKHLLLISKES